MDDFWVMVSDIAPPVWSGAEIIADEENFPRCGQYLSNPSDGRHMYLNCDDYLEGQYVYVVLPGYQYMTMCEVMVYNDSEYSINI